MATSLAKRIYDATIDEKHDPMKQGMIVPLIDSFMLSYGRDMQRFDDDCIDIIVKLIREGNDRLTSRKARTSFSGGGSASCMREQVINLRAQAETPLPIDSRLLSIFEDGNWRNIKWITMFQRAGLLVRYEHPYFSEEFNMSLTPDAELDLSEYYGDEFKDVPVEIKGMHTGEFKKFVSGTSRDRWARGRTMQVHAYMIARNKKWWVIWAEDKNTQEYAERIMPRNEQLVEFMKKRYRYMIKAMASNALPAVECELAAPDLKFTRCRQKDACRIHIDNDVRTLSPLKNRKIMEAKARTSFR